MLLAPDDRWTMGRSVNYLIEPKKHKLTPVITPAWGKPASFRAVIQGTE